MVASCEYGLTVVCRCSVVLVTYWKFELRELLRVKFCWWPQLIAVFVAPAWRVWLRPRLPER